MTGLRGECVGEDMKFAKIPTLRVRGAIDRVCGTMIYPNLVVWIRLSHSRDHLASGQKMSHVTAYALTRGR